MTVLRSIEALFANGVPADEVGPLDLVVRAGDDAVLHFATARNASIAARLCAGIVKPTCGRVFVGDFDTRLQPREAKRRVGFVDARGWSGDPHAFNCEVAFRAEVWGIPHAVAERRARKLLAALGREADAYGFALALALIAPIDLVVLDQPAARYCDDVRRIEPSVALVQTHVRVPANALRPRRRAFAP